MLLLSCLSIFNNQKYLKVFAMDILYKYCHNKMEGETI